ncbi:Ankyrin-2 [Diplodia seriata]|uniref:Ankyrin-2 n=1 Tax=Diplodia seriata TaxID=420778 RepID=A0A1S8B340_9PEZI|nr:Ankyrin-2 [Diplodia seriata]
MSDPLSIAASVGGLALLAKEIVQGISSVIESVRGAKPEMQKLSLSVATLYGTLKSLRLVLDQLPSADVATPGKAIFGCGTTLDNIQKLLARCGSESSNGVTPGVGASSSNLAAVAKPSTWDVTKHRATWLSKKHEIEKLLDELESHKSTLQLAMTQNSLSGIVEILRKQDETLSDLEEIKNSQARIWDAKIAEDKRRLSDERKKLLREVSSLRPEDSLQKHLGLRQDGTGLWFIKGPTFEAFQNTSNSRLWLYGIPGAGKSVLSAAIIDSLEQSEKMATAFFFCEYGNRSTQTIRQILGSVARQLAIQSSAALAVLEDFHNSHQDPHHSSINAKDSEWVELVQDLSANFDITTVVIDGLDECLEDRGSVVQNLATLSSRGSIKILFASREELDIKEALSGFESLPIAADRADVRLYVAAHLDSRFKRMTSKDPTLRREILESLVDRSEGIEPSQLIMHRCQLDHLESLPSNSIRRKALHNLPPDLPQTYQRILQRAIRLERECTLKFIERALRWIALSKRPMNLATITEAISVEPGEKEYDNTLEIEAILKSCGSLIRNINDIVSFSHFSVKEYLCQIDTSDQDLVRFRVNEENDQDYLASVCLTYLLLDDFSTLDLQDSTAYDRYTAERPFYDYAAWFWFGHARDSSNSQILEFELELFKPEKSDQFHLWAYTWLPQYLAFDSDGGPIEQVSEVTPLHLACVLCLPEVVDNLVKKGANINKRNQCLGPPLSCAIPGWTYRKNKETWPSMDKRLETVKHLLSENISRDISTYDPLTNAVHMHSGYCVALLLDAGFPVTTDALTAAMNGPRPDLSVTESLIEHTATTLLDAETRRLFDKMCIDYHLKSSSDHDERIPSGAVFEHLKKNYRQVLPTAASQGRLETVSSLLPFLSTTSEGERNEFLSLCLSESATNDQAEVVNFLINNGGDPYFQRESDGRTALHDLAWVRDLKIIRGLLQCCRDPRAALETKDHEGYTPWLVAIQAGRKQLLEYFLEVHPNIDFQQKTAIGQTAAHLAIKSGDEELFHYLQGLQEHSVDFKLPAADGRRPIHVLLNSLKQWWNRQAKIRMLRSLLVLEDDLSTTDESQKNLLHFLVDSGEPSEDLNEILRDVLGDGRYGKSRKHALISTDSHLRTPLHLCLEKLCKRLSIPGPDLEHRLCQVRLLANPPFESRDHLSVRGDNLRTPILAFARSASKIEATKKSKDKFQSVVSDVFCALVELEKDGSFSKQQDSEGMTALHYVAQSESGFPIEQVVSAFLKQPIDLSIKDKRGNTPLMVAAMTERDNIDFLRLTLPRMNNAELDKSCEDGVPLIHHICKKPGLEQLLPNHMTEFAQSRVLDENGCMPLVHLLKLIPDIDVAFRMIGVAGKTIDACDNMGHSCLYWACRLGADPVVAALVDRYEVIDEPLLDHQRPDGSTFNTPPLLLAAFHGNMDTVRMLIQKGANPFVEGTDGWQLHHVAMFCGYPSLLDVLETVNGFNFETSITFYLHVSNPPQKLNNARALHLAASFKPNTVPLEWLLSNARDLDLDPKTDCGNTPLHIACVQANLEACKLLVTAGASQYEADKDGGTPLHYACLGGSLDICQYLLSHQGILANANEQAPVSPVEIASQRGDMDMVKVLLQHNCSVSALAELNALRAGNLELADLIREQLQAKQGFSQYEVGTSEEIAASRLDIICQGKAAESEAALLTLIPQVRNLDRRVNSDRDTALHIASKYGWVKAIDALIGHGASLDLLDNLGTTPFLLAAECGQLECAKILHRSGSNITMRDMRGGTVLHLAVAGGHCNMLEYFLDQGLDVNAESWEGLTPLHLAKEPGCFDLLLRRGADPFRLSKNSVSPLSSFSVGDFNGDRICRMLTDQPPQKVQEVINNKLRWCNFTLLYLYAFWRSHKAVKILLGLGANVNQLGGKFGTPIQVAWKLGNFNIATLLLENGAKPFQRVYPGIEQAAWYWELGAQTVIQLPDGTWTAE